VRKELGAGAEDFLIVLLFGGKGSPEMQPLAARLLETGADWLVVAICGDNPRLYASLARVEAGSRGRLHRLAFTERVADYMAACDLLVTKPGPGSLAEAFHQGVPVVVARNLHTIPQERFNTQLVEERGLGLVVRSWRQIPEAVSALAQDRPRLAALRANVAALPENRAVWEAVAIIGEEIGYAEASGTTPRRTGRATRVLG
jgi:1,2-diacylglycerol 3-beta-galactosyltransferase